MFSTTLISTGVIARRLASEPVSARLDRHNLMRYNQGMVADAATNDLLFEVITPLGFRVRVARAYWELIISIKHPVMAGRAANVQETLRNPDKIRLSRSDPEVYLFYKSDRLGRWVCAVAKRLNGAGFLITAYPTDAIKEGEQIWPK